MTIKRYESRIFTSKLEALKALETENPEIIIDAILGLVNGVNDHEWVLKTLLKYVNHPDTWVARAAISGLGDIARIYGTIDIKLVFPILEELKKREDLVGKIEDALDDIKMFVKE